MVKLNLWRKFQIWLCDRAIRKAGRELEDVEYHLARLTLIKRRYLIRWGVDSEKLWSDTDGIGNAS